MSEHRWSKFWWADWMRDPSLRSCSVAARGLWMDMLAIAFDGTPRGHVTIGGNPASLRQLATIAGITERQCIGLLAELEQAGVFSRTPSGCMFNRRMVRDTEVSEAGREAIAKRWGKAQDPISPPNRVPKSPPHSLEAEADTETERSLPPVCPPSGFASPTAPPRPANGCRLPADWKPAEPGYEGATANTLAKFRDYWTAQAGAKGRKADWEATWRNWCRRDAEQPRAKLHTLPPAEQDRRILAAVGLQFDDPQPNLIPQRRAIQ